MFIDSNTLVLNTLVLRMRDDMQAHLHQAFKEAGLAPSPDGLLLAAQSAACVLLASKPAPALLAAPVIEAIVDPAPKKEHGGLGRAAKKPRVVKRHRAALPKSPDPKLPPSRPSRRLLKCPHCTEEFKSDGWLVRHMLRTHGTLSAEAPANPA